MIVVPSVGTINSFCWYPDSNDETAAPDKLLVTVIVSNIKEDPFVNND